MCFPIPRHWPHKPRTRGGVLSTTSCVRAADSRTLVSVSTRPYPVEQSLILSSASVIGPWINTSSFRAANRCACDINRRSAIYTAMEPILLQLGVTRVSPANGKAARRAKILYTGRNLRPATRCKPSSDYQMDQIIAKLTKSDNDSCLAESLYYSELTRNTIDLPRSKGRPDKTPSFCETCLRSEARDGVEKPLVRIIHNVVVTASRTRRCLTKVRLSKAKPALWRQRRQRLQL